MPEGLIVVWLRTSACFFVACRIKTTCACLFLVYITKYQVTLAYHKASYKPLHLDAYGTLSHCRHALDRERRDQVLRPQLQTTHNTYTHTASCMDRDVFTHAALGETGIFAKRLSTRLLSSLHLHPHLDACCACCCVPELNLLQVHADE